MQLIWQVFRVFIQYCPFVGSLPSRGVVGRERMGTALPHLFCVLLWNGYFLGAFPHPISNTESLLTSNDNWL